MICNCTLPISCCAKCLSNNVHDTMGGRSAIEILDEQTRIDQLNQIRDMKIVWPLNYETEYEIMGEPI